MNNYHDQAARLRDELADKIGRAITKAAVFLTIEFIAALLVVMAGR